MYASQMKDRSDICQYTTMMLMMLDDRHRICTIVIGDVALLVHLILVSHSLVSRYQLEQSQISNIILSLTDIVQATIMHNGF
jgi:hypothetical protein